MIRFGDIEPVKPKADAAPIAKPAKAAVAQESLDIGEAAATPAPAKSKAKPARAKKKAAE